MKAGIIFGLLALGLGASVTMLSSICLPFFALLIGLGAGYMGGFFDRPTESSGALRSGMWAGLIAGIFMVLGQILGTVGAATFLGPTRSALIVKSLGLPSFNPPGAASSSNATSPSWPPPSATASACPTAAATAPAARARAACSKAA